MGFENGSEAAVEGKFCNVAVEKAAAGLLPKGAIGAMLASTQRLRRSSDIRRVYRTGHQSHHPLLRFITAPSLRATPRGTVIVSVRVSKKATERNRLKRQVRVILRKHLQNLKQPHDCLLILTPKARMAQYHELEQAVAWVFARQKLI